VHELYACGILVCAKMCDFIEDIEAGGKARLVRIGTVEPPEAKNRRMSGPWSNDPGIEFIGTRHGSSRVRENVKQAKDSTSFKVCTTNLEGLTSLSEPPRCLTEVRKTR